ncbi:MAG: type II CRISPR-associated endonuclease Cas1 [Rickettsiales bacterium]|jgi:CRISPR-associated protein Cas1|nr:type II CRISPR-associated endonuclease Cas1 [Rickettsiales bacterium]
MANQIVEISKNKYLSLQDGFFVVSEDNKPIGKFVIDNLDVIIISGYNVIYSNTLLVRLAENNIPVVLCDEKYIPIAILTPMATNHEQAKIFELQIQMKQTTKNLLWQKITKHKLLMQAEVLKTLNKEYLMLVECSKRVLSGDTTNKEAEGARKYWKTLFGNDFRRDTEMDGINALLNYGYAVLRSIVARCIVGSGLHCALGLFHKHPYNAYRLADDLMEPFRPILDLKVYNLWMMGRTELDVETKKELIGVFEENVRGSLGLTEYRFCIQNFVSSLAQFLLGNRNDLEFIRKL